VPARHPARHPEGEGARCWLTACAAQGHGASNVRQRLRLSPPRRRPSCSRVTRAAFAAALLRICRPTHRTNTRPQVEAWRARGRVPLGVDITASLLETALCDATFWAAAAGGGGSAPAAAGAAGGTGGGSSSSGGGRAAAVSRQQLRMQYAAALVRMVNGIADSQQRARVAVSVAGLAEAAGLSRLLVDVRHEATHNELPSLPTLQLAARQALDWLLTQYWCVRVFFLWGGGVRGSGRGWPQRAEGKDCAPHALHSVRVCPPCTPTRAALCVCVPAMHTHMRCTTPAPCRLALAHAGSGRQTTWRPAARACARSSPRSWRRQRRRQQQAGRHQGQPGTRARAQTPRRGMVLALSHRTEPLRAGGSARCCCPS
jgi:hypothetical protein